MKSNKELNRAISAILDEPETYDVRRDLRIIKSGLSRDGADEYLNLEVSPQEDPNRFTITSTPSPNYVGDTDLALYAAKRIAERNECTFVLSLETGTWKAAFGNWGDCAEVSGSNPAYVTCVSILKFMGKL